MTVHGVYRMFLLPLLFVALVGIATDHHDSRHSRCLIPEGCQIGREHR